MAISSACSFCFSLMGSKSTFAGVPGVETLFVGVPLMNEMLPECLEAVEFYFFIGFDA